MAGDLPAMMRQRPFGLAGGLDLQASGVFPHLYGRGKSKARQGFKRCGCNPFQADLKTTNQEVIVL
jgi:hypothetical protein